MKKCSTCKIEKDESEYSKYRSVCKKCINDAAKNKYKKLKEENKCVVCLNILNKNNKKVVCDDCGIKHNNACKVLKNNLYLECRCVQCGKILDKLYTKKRCKECLNKKIIAYQEKIKQHKCVKCNKIINDENKTIYCDSCKKKQLNYYSVRYKNDPIHRFRKNISKYVCMCLRQKGSNKNGESILKYLPYTMDQLIEHLRSKFEPWMTLENHGNYRLKDWDDNDQSTWVWHIDHIIPQDALPYASMEDENFKKCWALENLRPLSAKENIKKGNKIIEIVK